MAGHFHLRWLLLFGALAVMPLSAQERPATGPREPADAASEPGPSPPAKQPAATDKPAPAAPTSSREFKPSEEVSPDQEVDFPADL